VGTIRVVHPIRRTSTLDGLGVMVGVVALLAGFALPAFAAKDPQAAKASLLQLADLPTSGRPGFTGWLAVSPGGDSSLTMGNLDPAFAACAATNKIEQASSKYRSDSPDFSSNSDAIGNSIYVFPNAKKAKAYVAAYAKPEAQQCFQHGVEKNSVADDPRTFPPFDATTVSGGSLNEGVGFDATIGTAPQFSDSGTATLQDVRFRAGRAVIFLSTYYGGYPNQPAAAFPGTATYFSTIATRLQQHLKK
jgi:hypothetical protein